MGNIIQTLKQKRNVGSQPARPQRNLFFLKGKTDKEIRTYEEMAQNIGKTVGTYKAKTLEYFKNAGGKDADANYNGWYSINPLKRPFIGHFKEVETVCEEVALKAMSQPVDLTEFELLLGHIRIKECAPYEEQSGKLALRNALLPSYTQGFREGIVEEGLKIYNEAYDERLSELREANPSAFRKAFDDGKSWVGEEKGKDSGKEDARAFLAEKPYECQSLIVSSGGESSADPAGYSFYFRSRPNLIEGKEELVKEAAAYLTEGKKGPFYRFSFLRGAKMQFDKNYAAGYDKG
jgi:hypothetical protein